MPATAVHRYLLLASDGVWDYMSGDEALAVVARHGDRVGGALLACAPCLGLRPEAWASVLLGPAAEWACSAGWA
jgi:hypothetical protein